MGGITDDEIEDVTQVLYKDYLRKIQNNLLNVGYDILYLLKNSPPIIRLDMCYILNESRTTVYDNIVKLTNLHLVTKYSKPLNNRGRPLVYFRLTKTGQEMVQIINFDEHVKWDKDTIERHKKFLAGRLDRTEIDKGFEKQNVKRIKERELQKSRRDFIVNKDYIRQAEDMMGSEDIKPEQKDADIDINKIGDDYVEVIESIEAEDEEEMAEVGNEIIDVQYSDEPEEEEKLKPKEKVEEPPKGVCLVCTTKVTAQYSKHNEEYYFPKVCPNCGNMLTKRSFKKMMSI